MKTTKTMIIPRTNKRTILGREVGTDSVLSSQPQKDHESVSDVIVHASNRVHKATSP